MPLVNTQGLTLIGAGSEWFWSMLQFVIVALTLVGIYVQLRQDRSANAFAQANALREEWEGEGLVRRRVALTIAIRDGAALDELAILATPVANFWENVAGLVRARHIAADLVYRYLGAGCLTTWNLLEPTVRHVQAEEGVGVWSDFEWLSVELGKRSRARGDVDGAITMASFAQRAPALIDSMQRRLKDLEALRSVPSASITSAAPSSRARRGHR